MQNPPFLFATGIARVSETAQRNKLLFCKRDCLLQKEGCPCRLCSFSQRVPDFTYVFIQLNLSRDSWQIAHISGSDFTAEWNLMDLAGSLLDPCGTM